LDAGDEQHEDVTSAIPDDIVESSNTQVTAQTPSGLDIALQDETNNSMIRAVVSNGTEALDLLLQGVSNGRADDHHDTHSSLSPTSREQHQHDGLFHGRQAAASVAVEASRKTETMQLWSSSKFVRTGWTTAESVIMYMDL